MPATHPLIVTAWLRRFRFRRNCAAAVGGLTLVLAGYGAAALTAWLPELLLGIRLSERASAAVLLSALALAIAGGVCYALLRLIRGSSLRALAEKYCRETPGDRNALETALELEQRAALSAFEAELLAEYQRHFAAGDFGILRGSGAFRLPALPRQLSCLIALLLIIVFVPISPQGAAWRHLLGAPAIEFSPELPVEVPRHSDLTVVACVNRENLPPLEIELTEAGARRGYPMAQSIDGRPAITLYDICEPLRLRAKAPLFASAWHDIAVYDPPAPTAVRITVTPPAYTRRDTQTFEGFRDCAVIAGSRVVFDCELPADVTWRLQRERYDSAAEELVLPESAVLRAHFRDSAGHIAESLEFTVTVEPDLPPVLTVEAPGEDAELTAGDELQAVLRCTDEFGVRRIALRYVLDTADEQQLELWQGQGEQLVELDELLPLPDLPAGQILTGYFIAEDNCEPTANRVRSELFFVTVVPPKDAGEQLLQQPQNSSDRQQQEVKISDLIAESKRLLRNTFDWSMLTEELQQSETGKQRSFELSRDLRALGLAVRQRAVTIAEHLGQELPAELTGFFEEIAESFNRAGFLVEHGDVANSRPPQQHGLSQLVYLNNLLMQNASKSGGSQGQSNSDGSAASDENSGGAPPPESASRGDRQRDIERMKQAREELERIRQEQQRIGEAARRGDEPAQNFGAPQSELAERTRAVAEALSGVESASGVQEPLRLAGGEMRDASQQFSRGEQENALLAGMRAEAGLNAALSALSEAIKADARAQMQQLSQDTAELAAAQRRAAANSASGEGSRDEQEALNEQTSALQQRVNAAARELNGEFRAAAQALQQSLSPQQLSELLRAQQRARNALVYRRQGSAAEMQGAAAALLSQWSEQLRRGAEELDHAPAEDIAPSRRRRAVSPPAKYRREVYEYFRRLGEE